MTSARPAQVSAALPWLALASAMACGAAQAADPAPSEVPALTVIAATPLPGAQIDVAKAPYDVRTLSAADIGRDGRLSAAGALDAAIGGVNINDNLDDAFQPDILYRGFEASPVLGTPQGLAVYQNGVRINEAFGDVVNWDLIADPAVARIDVVGSNPVYGLNALGGAVVVAMKDGFDDAGVEAQAGGGSFGARSAQLTFGAHTDHVGVFLAARALDQDGWRAFSADRVRQLYADFAARSDRLKLDLSFEGADNLLHGQSAAPVQELAVSRRLVFTSPQANADRLAFVVLKGSFQATQALSLQGEAYYRGFHQSVDNGNTTDYAACTLPGLANQLCQSDGATPLVTTTGAAIPDISSGGSVPIGENDREALNARGYGGSVQITAIAPFLGLGNQASAGAAFDGADIDFRSSAELGVIDAALVVQPSGLVVSTPEGTPFTATPVSLSAADSYAGVYFTDTLDLTARLAVTASGRFNSVRIALLDHQGVALNGVSRYDRFDPAIGASYRLTPGLTAYFGYAEGSRAPTASEIECSDPANPACCRRRCRPTRRVCARWSRAPWKLGFAATATSEPAVFATALASTARSSTTISTAFRPRSAPATSRTSPARCGRAASSTSAIATRGSAPPSATPMWRRASPRTSRCRRRPTRSPTAMATSTSGRATACPASRAIA